MKKSSLQSSHRSASKTNESVNRKRRVGPSASFSGANTTNFTKIPMPKRAVFKDFDAKAFGGKNDDEDLLASKEYSKS